MYKEQRIEYNSDYLRFILFFYVIVILQKRYILNIDSNYKAKKGKDTFFKYSIRK